MKFILLTNMTEMTFPAPARRPATIIEIEADSLDAALSTGLMRHARGQFKAACRKMGVKPRTSWDSLIQVMPIS